MQQPDDKRHPNRSERPNHPAVSSDEGAETLEKWARDAATHDRARLALEVGAQLGGLQFRVRARVLDGALSILLHAPASDRSATDATLETLRALASSLDLDELRATLEALRSDTLARLTLMLGQTEPALFGVALSAWPGALPWVSAARLMATWPGDDDVRRTLFALLASDARASSRVRAISELVALGSSSQTIDAIASAASDAVHDLRTAAVRALGRMGATAALVCLLDSPHATVRADARLLLEQLAKHPDQRRAEIVASLVAQSLDQRQSPRDRFESRRVLRSLGVQSAPEPWSRLHQDAADGLAHEVSALANRVAISEYVEVLADTDDERAFRAVRDALAVRAKVGRALAGFRAFVRGPRGSEALHELERDVDAVVRERAHELARMRG
jgi:hypothetical protein